MAGLDDFLDHGCVPDYITGVGDRKENLFNRITIGKVAAGPVGNQDRVAGNFRLPKSFHSFAECADDRKWKALDLDVFSDGSILAAIDRLGELLRDGGHMSGRGRVLRIEEAATQDFKVADGRVSRIYSQDQNVPLLASSHSDTLVQLQHGRSSLDSRHLLLHRFHVVHGQGVVGSADVHRSVTTALVVGVDQVGAHTLDLAHYVLLPSKANGDHHNQRAGSYDHAQSGQGKPYLARPEGIDG